MIDLRTALITYLRTLHPSVYYQAAPEDAQCPYIIIDFPNSNADGEGFENVPVDVDGWDINDTGDTTQLENLMSVINGHDDENGNPTGLNKRTLITDDLVVTFYLDNRLPIIDPDKRVKRRKYVYEARLFRRS